MVIKVLILLIIAFFCGSIGAKLAGASKKGCVTSIALGFIGGLIGSWISRKMQIPELLSLQGIPIVWSIIGSALFVAVINLISGENSRKK
jgi:uncharacterized membrane protein YeaQ/YmgE (transglycosylase-associated protein family)